MGTGEATMAIPREAERLWTAEDLLALGEEARYELIEGRLVPMSPTGSLHGDLVAELTMILRSFVRAHQLGRVLTGEVGSDWSSCWYSNNSNRCIGNNNI
jgi:Uma2 family endonuclease